MRRCGRLALCLTIAAVAWGLSLSAASAYTFGPTITPIGSEQTVFDWTTSRCEDLDIPDTPARAFRDWQGRTQLIASHFHNYRMRGPSLDSVSRDCNQVMGSHNDPLPSSFNNWEWITAPYTKDGKTVYALIHNEYHGWEHPGMCTTQGSFDLKCWYNSITLATSNNRGASYSHATAPKHLIAAVPYQYTPDVGPCGIFQPSGIVSSGGYYYALVNTGSAGCGLQLPGTCVMRTSNLADPTSWRAWDGTGYNVTFINPYVQTSEPPDQHVCQRVSFSQIQLMTESLTWNTYLGKWLLVGASGKYDPATNRTVYGFYYSTSTDLVNWSDRQLLAEVPIPWICSPNCTEDPMAYPSLLDPTSTTRNYETTGRTPYLYFTRFHYLTNPTQSLDRDLVRIKIQFN